MKLSDRWCGMGGGGKLAALGESLTLRNEGKPFRSSPFTPTLHGKKMCQASHTGHWVQMPPSLWRPEAIGIEKTGIPLGNGSAKSSHRCTFENFLTSRPSVKGIWTSPCLQPWHGLVSECLHSQDSTRHQWADYVKTFEDKAKWNFKRLRKAWNPLSEVRKFSCC